MIKEITIQNFKSIADDTISLGRVNVFIGENGSGKSNILEAIAFASAAREDKLDTESLYAKGIRNAKPSLMFNSFAEKRQKNEIRFIVDEGDDEPDKLMLTTEDTDDIFAKWNIFFQIEVEMSKKMQRDFETRKKELGFTSDSEMFEHILNLFFKEHTTSPDDIQITPVDRKRSKLEDYVIYSLSTKALRGIYSESKKEPVGINGENLDVLISSFDKKEVEELKNYTYLISWLEDFFIDREDLMKLKGFKLNRSTSTLYFKDRFMMKKGNNNVFSTENANEGILHILFYLALLISKRTPKFFAIDNIESCLNPHLCTEIMREICKLAKKESINKQLLLTTHNPAILDGLNLNDDEIRLFEVYRNNEGHTKTRRIQLNPDTKPEKAKLSELWTRGYLGAINKRF